MSSPVPSSAAAPGRDIFEIASTRWLHADEIEHLLTPETCPLSPSTSRPSSPPQSGTLILYDRSVVRKYKNDGHVWVKKKGHATKVREDHVKLRLDGREVITGTYVHCSVRDTMHRRAYRLLEGPDEPPAVQKRKQNWVLVHYLDAAEAAQIASELAFRRSGVARKGSTAAQQQQPPPPQQQQQVPEVKREVQNLGRHNRGEAHRQCQVHQAQRQTEILQTMSNSFSREVANGSGYGNGRPSSVTWGYQPPPQQQKLWPQHQRAGTDYVPSCSSATPYFNGSNNVHATRDPAAHCCSPSRSSPVRSAQPPSARPHPFPPQHPPQPRRRHPKGERTYSFSSEDFPDFVKAADPKRHRKQESSLDDITMSILWSLVGQRDQGGPADGSVSKRGCSNVSADELEEAAAAAIRESMDPIVEEELAGAVESALQDAVASCCAELGSEEVGKPIADRFVEVSDNDIADAVDKVMREAPAIEEKVVGALQAKMPPRFEEEIARSMEKNLQAQQSSSSFRWVDAGEEYDEEEDSNCIGGRWPGHFHSIGSISEVADDINAEALQESDEEGSSVEDMEDNEDEGKVKADVVPSSSSTSEVDGDAFRSPLPDIIVEANVDPSDHKTLIIVSTSTPIPVLPSDETFYKWQYLVTFVEEDDRGNEIFEAARSASGGPRVLAISPASAVTPFSLKCDLPRRAISKPGQYRVIMMAARLYSRSLEGLPVWNSIRAAAELTLRAEWRRAIDDEENLTGPGSDETGSPRSVGAGSSEFARRVGPTFRVPAGGRNVRLLSQLSVRSFRLGEEGEASAKSSSRCRAGRTDGSASVVSELSGRSDGSWPAPAPAMASVASAIGDILPSDLMPPPRWDDPDESARVWALSSFCSDSSAVDDGGPNSATVGDTVDRHCRVKFIEHLADTAQATRSTRTGAGGSVLSSAAAGGSGEVSGMALDDEELCNVDEDELDSILDGALIRFVTTLLDACSKDDDGGDQLRQHLDAAGADSGFALLHYAALYNMSALVPLLLSRGADPNKRTSNGGLTALHLAAGAGHANIATLLVRSGCDAAAVDSSGLTAADHATKNGFPEVAEWLEREAKAVADLVESSSSSGRGKTLRRGSSRQKVGQEQNGSMALSGTDELLQSAIRGLSLQGQLGIFTQRKKGNRGDLDRKTIGDSKKVAPCDGLGKSSPSAEDSDTNTSLSQEVERSDFGTINEADRKKVELVLSLLGEKERSKLDNDASYSSVVKWMLRSNYETLRDASAELERETRMKRGTTEPWENGMRAIGEKGSLASTNLSKALAMLVLRKKLLPGVKAESIVAV